VYNRDTSSERKLRNARYARAPIGMFMTRDRVVEIERRSGRQISDDRDACEEGEKSIEERVGDTFVVRLERKSRRIAYLRPNLLYTRKFVIVHLFLLLPWRSDRPAGAKSTVNVLLFLFRWFQDLE